MKIDINKLAEHSAIKTLSTCAPPNISVSIMIWKADWD
jgi:hypothetical protein